MVFAFFTTGVLYLVSLLAFAASALILAFDIMNSMVLGMILFFGSAVCILLSHITADKLDEFAMLRYDSDFDKAYRAARRRASRCFGGYKITAYLNIAYYCCAYERLEEAREVLKKVKRLVERNGSAFYYTEYLMLLLTYKKKTHDMSGIGAVLSEAAKCLNESRFVTKNGRSRFQLELTYSAAELELFSKADKILSGDNREAAAKMYNLARKRLAVSSNEYSYRTLSTLYSLGLSCVLTGRNREAEECFRCIEKSELNLPLCRRAERYALSGSITDLIGTTP